MVKLVILIQKLEDEAAFQSSWPEFLHLAEEMPGLQSESSGQVIRNVFGEGGFSLIHELYFDSQEALQRALSSPAGREAGKLLQSCTHGQVVLFIAEHREDTLENMQRFRP